MPDTAKLKTIALVRTAKITVSNAMASPTVPGPQKVLLFDLTGDLEDLEGALILDDIQGQVGKLTTDAADLKTQTAALTTSIAALLAVANDVNTAADAVAALITIAQSAASLGIVA